MIYGHSQELAKALPLIQKMRPRYWKWVANIESLNYQDDLEAAAWCAGNGVQLIVRNANWKFDFDRPGQGVDQASFFVHHCMQRQWFRYAAFIETPNEPMPGYDLTLDYIIFEQEVVRLLSRFDTKVIVGNMGTHQPTHFVEGAEYYGVHAYYGMLGDFPNIHVQAEAKFFLTEFGFTDAVHRVVPPGEDYDFGWQKHLGPAAYWDALSRYDIYLSATFPDQYLGSFLFQVGAQSGDSGNSGWSSFETLGTPIEQYLLEQEDTMPHTPADHSDLTVPAPDSGPSLVPGGAIEQYAIELGEDITGELLRSESSIGADWAYAVFSRGRIDYWPETGAKFTPFF